jgi:hypothetical protein
VVPLEEVVRSLVVSFDSLAEVRDTVADLVLFRDDDGPDADLLACKGDDGHAMVVFRPAHEHHGVPVWNELATRAEGMLQAYHPGAVRSEVGRWVQSNQGLDAAGAVTFAAAERVFDVARREAGLSPRVRRAEALIQRRLTDAQAEVKGPDAALFQRTVTRYQRAARLGAAVRPGVERRIRERLLRISPRVLDI